VTTQTAEPWAGVWIAEDIELIAQGVRNGSWVDGTLGVVGAGLDGLALVSDPVGALLQYGIAWLIEHVKPLSEALDWLAGDPAGIAAHARTWRSTASSLTTEAEALSQAVREDVETWSGSAAEAYRSWAAHREQSLRALGQASETMALITEGAGALIGTVRMMVRDAVATVVSRLIVYAGELIATAGLATPVVAEQVATLCAAWGAKIARWLKALLSSLRKLLSDGTRLGQLVEALSKGLGLTSGNRLTVPSGKPNPANGPRGRRTDAHPTRLPDRGRRRENESADVLAHNGYQVEQNPAPKANGKEPDYKVEGEYFDCYSPTSGSLAQIRKGMRKKVVEEQSSRIVLSLDDCPRSSDEIAALLRRRPLQGLEQVLVVQHGQVDRLFPFD
jgi:uncharacterized protein YukE